RERPGPDRSGNARPARAVPALPGQRGRQGDPRRRRPGACPPADSLTTTRYRRSGPCGGDAMKEVIMSREVDLLTLLDPRLYLLVEKATHQVWTLDELRDAARRGYFQQPDQLATLSGSLDISGPYPGCLQLAGAGARNFQHALFAQTRHFLVFLQPGAKC